MELFSGSAFHLNSKCEYLHTPIKNLAEDDGDGLAAVWGATESTGNVPTGVYLDEYVNADKDRMFRRSLKTNNFLTVLVKTNHQTMKATSCSNNNIATASQAMNAFDII